MWSEQTGAQIIIAEKYSPLDMMALNEIEYAIPNMSTNFKSLLFDNTFATNLEEEEDISGWDAKSKESEEKEKRGEANREKYAEEKKSIEEEGVKSWKMDDLEADVHKENRDGYDKQENCSSNDVDGREKYDVEYLDEREKSEVEYLDEKNIKNCSPIIHDDGKEKYDVEYSNDKNIKNCSTFDHDGKEKGGKTEKWEEEEMDETGLKRKVEVEESSPKDVTCKEEEEKFGTVEKCRTNAANETNNTSGQQGDASSASAAPSGSSSASGTNHAQSAGGARNTGTSSEGEGDQTPPNRGPPSRLSSQCEVSESGERKADQFKKYYRQEGESSLTLADDRNPQWGIVGGGEPPRIMCRDLKDFQAACHSDTQGRCFTYLRGDIQVPIKQDQYGRYCPEREYTKDWSVGEGSVGRVFRATDKKSGIHFAVKEVPPSQFSSGELNGLLLSHANIVTVYGAHVGPEDSDGCSPIISLFQEYVPGTVTLDSAMEKEWAWHPDDIVIILHQLLAVCCYIHKQGITHRDLHGGNILINEDMCIYIIDWGQSLRSDLPDGEATDIEQVVAFVSRLHEELLRQRSTREDMGWIEEDSAVELITDFLSMARKSRISGNPLTAAELLGELDQRLQDNKELLVEIASKKRPATCQRDKPKDEGQEAGPLAQEPDEDLSTGESEGAVGGTGFGSLVTDEDPFTSASSTFDRNLSEFEESFF